MADELKLRVCPFCGEWVKDRARRCRHCKRWIHHQVSANLNLGTGPIQLNLGPSSFWISDLYCPKCNEMNSTTATKCKRCGRRFYSTPEEGPSRWTEIWESLRRFINESDRECPYCAEDIPQDSQVCPRCNVQLNS